MRSTYWSCTNFADWLRGTMKPSSATSKGWSSWKKEAEKNHPIRYWIAEEGLDKLQNFVYWPADVANNIRYYINNRWVSKSHALTAHPRDIKPGAWCDVGNRFVYCLFNELVDFVEIETAWHHVVWDEEARKKFRVPWYRRGWFRWRTWRCPEAGIAHLEWASSLTHDATIQNGKWVGKPTHQAMVAMEILDLYHWWTEDRPNRPDPHDASGWSAICDRRREKNPDDFMGEDDTKEERAQTRRALKMIAQIEKKYDDEDERMLIRLIKIRKGLWT